MPPRSQSDEILVPLKPSINDDSDKSVTNEVTTKNNATKPEEKNTPVLPWYRRGGMHVNMIGMAFNISLPIISLLKSSNLSIEWIKYYTTIWALSILLSALPPCNMRTTYCVVVVPTFVTSLLLSLTFSDNFDLHSSLEALKASIAVLTCSIALAILKVNICMSVCLHRYAAHHAFKCHSKLTSFLMQLLGCLANQGGPIWWASQHRCHHKYCDLTKDPHSQIHMGIENAFGFFEIFQDINEMFVPKHLNSSEVLVRMLDTWSFVTVSMELYLSYSYFGRFGLFIAYTSGWICQSITLWFNIVNHPHDTKIAASTSTSIKDKCLASDSTPTSLNGVYYLPFYLLTLLHPLFSIFVMESEHKHHHDHAMLAKRSWYDVAYWGFVKPLEIAGLIYDVQV